MHKYCACGAIIPELRVKFLEKNGLKLSCITHSSSERVMCFQVISGKTERAIEIVSPAQAAKLEQLSKRAGMGVSRGVKMDQSFKANLFK